MLRAVLFLAASLAAHPPPIPDQHGTLRGLADHEGQAQFAVVVSARRLRRIKPWEVALAERYGELPIVRVAHVGPNTNATRADVADKLARRIPEDLNVAIDMEGLWVDAFDLDPSAPTILLFTADGTLAYQGGGMFNRSRFDEAVAALDQFLQPRDPQP